MGIMSGLLIPSEKFNILTGDTCILKDLLRNDLFLLTQLRDARYVSSNDLLYAYCTEYNLSNVICHMKPVDQDFSLLKMKLSPYLRGFYEQCVRQRLEAMFSFYKGYITAVKESDCNSFFGSKTFIDTLNLFSKETDRKKMDRTLDNVYLTMKNYLKYQFNETIEMIPNATVESFILNLETVLITCNDNLSDDQFRKKACQIIEIANLFVNYTKSLENVETWTASKKYMLDNRALVTYDQFWKRIVTLEGVAPLIQKALPYVHVETDAAVCLFPCTTDYPLLTSDLSTQGRRPNQNSQILILNHLIHNFFISLLEISKYKSDEWKHKRSI